MVEVKERSMACPRDKRITHCSPGPTSEGGCCQVIPPGRPCNFSVTYRNPGHWDVYTRFGRAFRIRGEPFDVVVLDERTDDSRPHPRDTRQFRTVTAALAWCADELMHPIPASPPQAEG